MNQINTAVIGAGHLGKLHIKMLLDIPESNFIGLYDSNPDTAASAAEQHNVKAFNTLDELLPCAEAICITATTSAHYEIAKRCLAAGKHILIEKPITAHIWEAEELVKTAAEKKLKIQVGHIERFNPALLSVEKLKLEPMFIQSDRLAQFNPRGTDVAVVLDLMIHDIDVILSLINSEVVKVDASGVAVVSDTLDIANARLEFANGAIANVTASRISQKKMRKMRIFQRDAYIAIDFSTGVSEIFRLLPPNEEVKTGHMNFGEIGIGERKKKIIYEQPERVEVNALRYEINLFIQSILNDTRPVVSGGDGLRALKIAKEIVTKIEEATKKAGLVI